MDSLCTLMIRQKDIWRPGIRLYRWIQRKKSSLVILRIRENRIIPKGNREQCEYMILEIRKLHLTEYMI